MIPVISFLLLPPQMPPGNVSATRTAPTVIEVKWEDRSADERGYLLQRKAGRGKFLWVANLPANATSFVDKKAKPEFSYGYRLRSLGPGGTSGWSNVGWVSFVPKPGTPIAAPTPTTTAQTPTKPITVVPGDNWAPAQVSVFATSPNSIRISWNSVSGAKEYRIFRSITSGKYDYSKPVAVVSPTAEAKMSFEDKGLKEGQEYFYVVRAMLK